MINRELLVKEAGKIELEGVVDQTLELLQQKLPEGAWLEKAKVKDLVYRLLSKGAVCQRRIDQIISNPQISGDSTQKITLSEVRTALLDPELGWWRLLEDHQQMKLRYQDVKILEEPAST